MRSILWLCVSACWLATCDSGREGSALPPVDAGVSVSGHYDVNGVTVVKRSGSEREISGHINLNQEGNRYTASFSLETTYPSRDGLAQAEVIGTGKGMIAGRTLHGTAETQIVMAAVPGVDTKFAFVPRIVGPRLVSTTVGQLAPDGTLKIEIDNEPAEGQDYAPTRTTLRGTRTLK
jgi:hypothetical protein